MPTRFSPHERSEIHITGELGPWYSLIHTNNVEGYVRWSENTDDRKGEKIALLNVELIPYPRSEEFGSEHFIARTQTNRYYILRKEHAVVL